MSIVGSKYNVNISKAFNRLRKNIHISNGTCKEKFRGKIIIRQCYLPTIRGGGGDNTVMSTAWLLEL